MNIILTFVISFAITIFLTFYERNAHKKHIIKSFFMFWATIEALIILITIQILGVINLFK